MIGCVVANKYIIKEKIGSGKFGTVFRGEHVKHKTEVAIKMEETANDCNTIKYETTILNYLYTNGCRVIPAVIWYGIYGDYKCLTMDYYNQTVDQYIALVRDKYTGSPLEYLKQIIKIIVNMVSIIGNVHKHNIIHRDIKPENFMLKDNELHLIDFGIASAATNMCDINTEPDRTTVIGSPKYISYYVHSGYEPMYRDDLISIGYCFFYFILGKLPWDDVSSTDNTPSIHLLHEKNQIRKKWKQLNNIEKIIQNIMQKTSVALSGEYNEIYKNISKYFAMCYNLQLDEKPFYDELITVLREHPDNV
jgi:casein kinase 1